MLIDNLVMVSPSQFKNLTLASGTSFPSQPNEGELYYHTPDSEAYVYNGMAWVAIGGGSSAEDIHVLRDDVETGVITPLFVATQTFSIPINCNGSFIYSHDSSANTSVELLLNGVVFGFAQISASSQVAAFGNSNHITFNAGDVIQYRVNSSASVVKLTFAVKLVEQITFDPPHVSGKTFDTVTVGTTTTVTGNVQVSALTPGYSSTFAIQTTVGTYGTFSLLGNGDWTYVLDTADADTIAIPASSDRFDIFQVQTVDAGVKGAVSVDVHAADNNVTVFSGDLSASIIVAAFGNVSVSGTIHCVNGSGSTIAVVPQNLIYRAGNNPTHGVFTIDASGSWTFTLPESSMTASDFSAGPAVIDTVSIAATTGATTSLSISISSPTHFNNDTQPFQYEAFIGYNGPGHSGYDGSIRHQLGAFTPDGRGVAFHPSTVVTNYGTSRVDAGGVWTFNINEDTPEFKSIVGGGSAVLHLYATAGSDNAQAPLTVTVYGKDDPTVITGDVAASLNCDGTQKTANGTLVATDPDAGKSGVVVQSTTTSRGLFVIDANGNWTYTLPKATADIMSIGTVYNEVIQVMTNSGLGVNVTITITRVPRVISTTNPDPLISNVAFLLQGNAPEGSTDIYDMGPHSLSVTNYPSGGGGNGGSPSYVLNNKASNKLGYTGLAFDGAGNGLTFSQNDVTSHMQLQNADFSFECFVKSTSGTVSYDQTLFSIYDATAGAAVLNVAIKANTNYVIAEAANDITGGPPQKAFSMTSNSPVQIGTWAHVMVNVYQGIVYLFLGGVFQSSAALNGQIISTVGHSCSASIGRTSSGSSSFAGAMDQIRLTVGNARITSSLTSNFAVPAMELPPADNAPDPMASLVKFYMPLTSNSFVDMSPLANSISVVGDCAITAGGVFDGFKMTNPSNAAAVSFVTTPFNIPIAQADDITMSGWVKTSGVRYSYMHIVTFGHNAANQAGDVACRTSCGVFNGKAAVFAEFGGSWILISSQNQIPVGEWCNITSVKSGNNLYLYVNGVQVANGSHGGFATTNGSVAVGSFPYSNPYAQAGDVFIGDIDNVKVTLCARHNSNFIVEHKN